MIPIYEQGDGQGIGHSFQSFREEFLSICKTHIGEDRAQAFAFIFYNFRDKGVRHVLKSQGGFARLDRLSSKDLSVFYLHNDNQEMIDKFNNHFLNALNVKEDVHLPCVLFFKLKDKSIEDITIVELEREDLAFAFEELYSSIENYIEDIDSQIESTTKNKLIKVYKKTKSIAYSKFIEMLIQGAFKTL